jgi:hypothetical protein
VTPEFDVATIFAERVRVLIPDAGEDEARCRAFDYTVARFRAHHDCDLDTAKQAVMAAMQISRP